MMICSRLEWRQMYRNKFLSKPVSPVMNLRHRHDDVAESGAGLGPAVLEDRPVL